MKVKNIESIYEKYDVLLRLIRLKGRCNQFNICSSCPYYDLGCKLTKGDVCHSVKDIKKRRLQNAYKEFYSELSKIMGG